MSRKDVIRKIVTSRYVHLGFGLLFMYGVASAVTHTSRFEKVVESLRQYCLFDYLSRDPEAPVDRPEAVFYRKRHEERLARLTRGLFDPASAGGMQRFFASKGLVYEVWDQGSGSSYLLAPVLRTGYHKAELPDGSDFSYDVLGEKLIKPWEEYKDGSRVRPFVSLGEERVYIHEDSISPFLRRYFNALWASDPSDPRDFQWPEWELTLPLSRDLEGLCRDVFIYRHYRGKKAARAYFVEEGFNVFLPTMLLMAERLAADRKRPFSAKWRYERAYLTGLSLEPTYTMLTLLRHRAEGQNPGARELWNLFSSRLPLGSPERLTLSQISRASREILDELAESYGKL